MRDAMRVDRDQADRALAFQRAEPFLDAAGRQAEAAFLGDIGGDQFAVLRVACVACGAIASSRPSDFLSTGISRPPPSGSARKMPSMRCLARSRILMTRPE